MITQFVSLEVPLPDLRSAVQGTIALPLQERIAQALATYGTPLRWAITAIDRDRQVAQIEAVVTVDASSVG